MEWPTLWKIHWIVPLYKRNSVFLATNYRGVHFTAQMSKLFERVIKRKLEPHLEKVCAYGPNQFAYRKERGARDLVLTLILEWLTVLDNRGKIALFCSDVSGAFDKVCTKRLAMKLRHHRVHERMVELLISWLSARRAQVIVGGARSDEYQIDNQVYQGNPRT